MKHTHPKEGWPWERPGHQFYTDKMRAWLGGYEPRIAAEMCSKPRGHNSSTTASATRTKALAAGETWASGTVPGMGLPNDPGKAMRMLKNSRLG